MSPLVLASSLFGLSASLVAPSFLDSGTSIIFLWAQQRNLDGLIHFLQSDQQGLCIRFNWINVILRITFCFSIIIISHIRFNFFFPLFDISGTLASSLLESCLSSELLPESIISSSGLFRRSNNIILRSIIYRFKIRMSSGSFQILTFYHLHVLLCFFTNYQVNLAHLYQLNRHQFQQSYLYFRIQYQAQIRVHPD